MHDEKEYLARYRQSDYPCPSVTADIAAVKPVRSRKPMNTRKAPLNWKGEKYEAFFGCC